MRKVAIIALSLVLCAQAPGLAFAESDSEIQIRNLAEGVWLHTSHYTYPGGIKYPSNGLIVRDGEELILVDTAWGELKTVALMNAIEKKISLPVTKAVVTHSHSDRAAGVDVLESRGVDVNSHPLTQRFATEQGSPVPNNTFDSLVERGSVTTLGRVQVFFPGPAHAMDNLMVWLPKEQVLFGGCAVRAGDSTSAGNTAQSDIESWIQVMSYVEERYESAVIVVPGHGEPGGPELIHHTSRLLREAGK